jgi:hypothetical protein
VVKRKTAKERGHGDVPASVSASKRAPAAKPAGKVKKKAAEASPAKGAAPTIGPFEAPPAPGAITRLGLWPRPIWRDASAYPSGAAIGPARLTWEFMRRTEAYAEAWLLAQQFVAAGKHYAVEQIASVWHVTRLEDPTVNDGIEFRDLSIEIMRPKALQPEVGAFGYRYEPKHDLQFGAIFDLSRSREKQIRLLSKAFKSLVQEAKKKSVSLAAPSMSKQHELFIRKVLEPYGAAPPPWPRMVNRKPRLAAIPRYLRIIDALATEFATHNGTHKALCCELAAGLDQRATTQNVGNVEKDIVIARRYAQGAYWEIQAFQRWKK